MEEGTRGEASHGCGHCGMTSDSGGVKGLICETVLIKLPCGGIPLVRGVIRWVVFAGFCDLVLEDGIKTVSKLQDDCEIIQVP